MFEKTNKRCSLLSLEARTKRKPNLITTMNACILVFKIKVSFIYGKVNKFYADADITMRVLQSYNSD